MNVSIENLTIKVAGRWGQMGQASDDSRCLPKSRPETIYIVWAGALRWEILIYRYTVY
jgi:hypothetical protein